MNEILEKALRKKIERLDAFEERVSVRFENISIKVRDKDEFTLFYEVHSNEGTTITKRFNIECVLYDQEGLILDTCLQIIFPDEFYGFEVRKMNFSGSDIADRVGKIRIYPKKAYE